MTTEDKSRESMARSNALFEKALGLLDKESSGDINEVTITNYIATNYLSVGETEKALEIFKRNNIHNMNSSLISYLYAIELNQPDESLKYAKKTIIDMVKTHKVWPCLLIAICFLIGIEAVTMLAIECIEGNIYFFIPVVFILTTVNFRYKKKQNTL